VKRLLVLVSLGAACHAAPLRDQPAARSELAVHDVVAVTQQGDALYVFERDRATITRAGVPVATLRPPAGEWAEAATIPALDGEGTWVVARGSAGELWRIATSGELEPIHDRFQLTGAQLIGAAAGTVALAVTDGVAVLRDRAHVARFAVPGVAELAVGRDRVALRREAQIELWDLARGSRVHYRVPDATRIAFLDAARAPKLVVAHRTGVLVERSGELAPLAAPGPVADVAVAGERLWLRSGAELYVGDATGALARVPDAPAGKLFGLASGDVVVAAPEHAVELSVATVADPKWDAVVRPIFQRVCARCHLPGGTANVDLSTPEAWRTEHAELVARVVKDRSMPPEGVELSDADRRALAQWLGL